ncbi:IS481 family transposase [Actinomadura logoneensis]|uniref:IS481 family transposase n=1 Tax=Actinomadura logoneensis TaxID=2293572 RepID=A0A372JQF2_9ACTN|nr:IS481 family transposase [Actinomadura logoneensis]RFU42265.1 IS481 family transposase [Actinomadura logoneensis]
MSHANARLTLHGRCLLVRRVVFDGRPVAHVAAELGISRQCAHRWVGRYRRQGWDGLAERRSGPRTSPSRTPAAVEERVLAARREMRAGPDHIAAATGVPARTVTRILRRHGVPALAACDPLTGTQIRATRHSDRRYEHPKPGAMIHLDVKKLGRIPDGGGWRMHGRSEAVRGRGIGYDFVHTAIDDHTRLAYAEVLPDEKGTTCAAFLTHAAAFFAAHGITRIQRVLTDNARNYRSSHAFQQACADLGAHQKFTRPRCPWTNGKAERLNRTLATEWAYRRPYTSNQQRTDALGPWLEHYNTQRPHFALGGKPPITRLSPRS